MTVNGMELKPRPQTLDSVPIKYVMEDRLAFACTECGVLSRLEEAINPDCVDRIDIHCPPCEESLEYSSPFNDLVRVTGVDPVEEVCDWSR